MGTLLSLAPLLWLLSLHLFLHSAQLGCQCLWSLWFQVTLALGFSVFLFTGLLREGVIASQLFLHWQRFIWQVHYLPLPSFNRELNVSPFTLSSPLPSVKGGDGIGSHLGLGGGHNFLCSLLEGGPVCLPAQVSSHCLQGLGSCSCLHCRRLGRESQLA